MSESALKAAYEDVLKLPEDVQADAAELLREFIAQHSSDIRLSRAQIDEVKRRLAEPNPEYASDEEMDEFFGRVLNES